MRDFYYQIKTASPAGKLRQAVGITLLLAIFSTKLFALAPAAAHNSAPFVATISFTSSNPADPNTARVGDVVTLNFTTNETVDLPVVTIATQAVTTLQLAGKVANTYRATYAMLASDAPGTVPFTISLETASGESGLFGQITFNINLNFVPPPVIAFIGTLTALNTNHGTASGSINFFVSGENMTEGILVTPPPGFEVSADNNLFSGTVTVGSAGTIETTVYVRLASADAVASYSGNIVLSSAGALSVNVATATSVVGSAPLISYSSPHTYSTGTAILPLSPASNGVASAGYNSNPVVFDSGIIAPNAVAVDASGNVYVPDPSRQQVKKFPAAGGAPVIIGSGFNSPQGVAVDKAGNVYVADEGNHAVYMITPGGVQTSIGSGFALPVAIATDNAGNIYVADLNNSAIIKLPAGGGSQVNIGAFGSPAGVAADAAGNVYVVDQRGPSLQEIPAGGGAQFTLTAGSHAPFGVGTDAAGNLYVANALDDFISMVPVGGGAPVTLGSGLHFPRGVAVDAAGNVYVADFANNATKKIIPVGGYYLGVPLPPGLSFNGNTGVISGTPTAASPATNYTITAYNAGGGSAAAAVNIKVQSNNANLTNLAVSSGTLSPAFAPGTNSYTANVVNAVSFITITPTMADTNATATVKGKTVASDSASTAIPLSVGPNTITTRVQAEDGTPDSYTIIITRLSLPVISYSNPNVYTLGAAISPLSPVSSGVAAVAYNSSPGSIGSGFSFPNAVATDAAGNVYVADAGHQYITEMPAAGGGPVAIGSGFSDPEGVALDKAGNVYVADVGNHAVYKITPGGVQTSIGSGFSSPAGIAADQAGNMYVADRGKTTIIKLPADGSAQVNIGSGFGQPNGVATDPAGNVFVTDQRSFSLLEIPVGGGAPFAVNAGSSGPWGVAADAAGNLYLSNGQNDFITMVHAPVTVTGNVTVKLGSGLHIPRGVAADAAGNVYVADFVNNAIKKIIPVGGYYLSAPLPAGLSFDVNTGIISGTPTAPGPATNYTITAYGAGGGSAATVNIKVKSNNADLTNIKLSTGSLNPAFTTATTSYTAGVRSPIASITVTPALADTNATVQVRVNGGVYTAVSGGGASAALALNEGSNPIDVQVTSEDGSTVKTYTVTVTRAIAADLSITMTATPEPVSMGGTITYTVKVTNNGPAAALFAVAEVTFPAGMDYNSFSTGLVPSGWSSNYVPEVGSLAFNNTTAGGFASGVTTTFSFSIKPKSAASGSVQSTSALVGSTGANPTPDPDMSNNTAAVNTTILADDAGLSALSSTAGTLSPTFATGTTGYAVSVPNTTTSVTVTPIVSQAKATIQVRVNGGTYAAVTSGSASPALALNEGDNPIDVLVTAQDGSTTKTYTITVTRAVSADLSITMTASPQRVSMGGTITYTVKVTNNGPAAALNAVVQVTFPSGLDYNSFSTGPAPSGWVSNYLSGLGILSFDNTNASGFAPGVTNTFSFSMMPKSAVSGSIQSTSALVGSTGPNPTPDPDMSNNNAAVNTTILANDAGLSALSGTAGTLSPVFSTATTGYTASVPGTTKSIAVIPKANQAKATIQVRINGGTYASVPSGNQSPALALNKGDNAIDVLVTAQDGTTIKTYTITVNRIAPPSISYSAFQSYTIGAAITPLAPVSSGVAGAGYSSSPVTIGSGFTQLAGVAADAAGNIYVADAANNLIKEIPLGKGLPVTFASITSPQCLAADAAGNIFAGSIISAGHVAIIKVPAGGGTPVTIPAAGIANPVSIALDAADNIYVGDITNHVAYKIPAGGGTATAIGTAQFNSPTGIAVDAAGNVYVADLFGKRVSMLPAGGGSAVAIGKGFNLPGGVAVDDAGNIFIVDSGNLAVDEIPAGGGVQFTVGSGFTGPEGIAIDAGGNLYVTEGVSKTVKEIPLTGGYYINPALPAGLSLDSNTGIISGTPTVVSPATNYTITAYNVNGSSAAIVNITTHLLLPSISYGSPQSYTIGAAITPLTPVSSGVAGAGYSSSPVTIGSGFTQLAGVAADAAGNIYVADAANNLIKEIPLGKGLPVTFASITSPQCLASDAAGNIFVVSIISAGHVAIIKVPAGGGTPVTIPAAGIANPVSIALDAADNIYVGDITNHMAYKIPAGGGTATAIGTAQFNSPTGIAVDAAGNVYVADLFGKRVSMLPAGGGSAVTIGKGFNLPGGVAVDDAGNIFIVDSGNLAVDEIPAGGGAQFTVGSGFTGPEGIAIDAGGNLYVTEGVSKTVKEIPLTGGYYISPALPAGLSLDSNTGIISGTPTVLSPATNYTITAYNAGGGSSAQVNIKVTPSAALTSLAVSSGTLTPAFATAITAYTDSVTNATASITLTPTSFDPNAAITVNGTTVISGSASGNLPLNVGGNAINVITTAADGTTTSTYTITVTRAPSADTRLNGLTLSSGAISPAFARGTFSYTASVTDTTSAVTVIPIATNANATIQVNINGGTYMPVTSGSASAALALNAVSNLINVLVTAQDGTTTGSYTITITVAPPAISYSSPQSYTVGIPISPLSPANSGGTVAAPAYSGSPVIFATGFNEPFGIAADAAGNIYVSDSGTHTVYKIPAGGGSPVALSSAFSQLGGIAADAAGNVYVADASNTTISKIPAGGGGSLVTLGSGFNAPDAVAVDAAGNVYVGDPGGHDVKKIPAGGGAPVIIASNILPGSISADAAGNVYVLDTQNAAIDKIPAGGSSWVNLISGLSHPSAVTVDASDNVFVSDISSNTIIEFPAGGGSQVSIGSGFNLPGQLVVDPSGTIYVADYNNQVVKQIKPVGGYYISAALPAGLSLDGKTGIISGTPTGVSPATDYTVTAYNNGGSGTAIVNIKTVSGNAGLVSMGPQYGPLSPVFSTGITGYTLNVSNTVKTMWVKPVAADPNATITVNGSTVASGTLSIPVTLTEGTATTITVLVTAQGAGATKTYTLNVTRGPSGNANLAGIGSSITPLTPIFSAGTTSYSLSVGNATKTMTVSPVAADPNSTITVNGNPVTSGALPQAVALAEGSTTAINVVVTAQNGATKTYTITVTRALPGNANLASIGTSTPPLTPFFVPQTTSYTVSVTNATKTMTLTPVAADPLATITVNTATVASGATSDPVTLAAAATTTVTVVVTAQDGTTKTYTINVTRAGSANNFLASMGPGISPMTPVFSPVKNSYTLSVPNTTQTMTVTPVTEDANATITVNTATVASKSTSDPVALTAGATTPINVTVTAQNGATNTYTIEVTRAPGDDNSFNPGISVTKPTETVTLAEDGIVVHQGISPNGDGVNDFLQIDNISQYPDNNLKIMNRNGQLVYEAKGYDNSSRTFDGHSNKNGQMQLPGTYFYQLDYTVQGVVKHKTGYLVLKY